MPRFVRALPLLVLAILPWLLTQLPPVRQGIIAFVEQMQQSGAVGFALYAGAYTIGAIMTVPVAMCSGIAGYTFGPVRGFLIASPMSAVGATAAFLLGRYALAGPMDRWMGESPRWRAIRKAIADDAFRVAVLLRLTPVAPQNFLSYGLSLTEMRARTFFVATWIGLAPVTAFQVYLGSLVHDVADLIDGKRPPLGPWSWVAPAAGLVVTLGVVVFLSRMGRRALARQGV